MFIVKVPGVNGNGKTKGCEKAGNAVIEALKDIHSNEQGKLVDVKLLDLEEIHFDNNDLKLTNKLIYENALETFEEKPKTIFLGGDQSISGSLGRAFLKRCRDSGNEPCLIVFDSRPNCLSLKSDFPNNVTWLRNLVENGFPGVNVLLVGVRALESQEIEFLNKNKIRNININQLMNNLDDTCDTIMEFSYGKELYLSIDLGIVDPVFVPATTFQDSGGLSSRQIIYLIQRINKIKNLKAVDLVEINPEKEGGDVTVRLGAKILSELL
ncbi:MAG: arginase family protein [Candidatus Pacearchaeota archaeon]|jgi:formiminoglutamase